MKLKTYINGASLTDLQRSAVFIAYGPRSDDWIADRRFAFSRDRGALRCVDHFTILDRKSAAAGKDE